VARQASFAYNGCEKTTAMGLTIAEEQVPLQTTEDGVVRVGGTRVTLDTVVAAFEQGATAEEIVQQYPSLTLADVYAAIGYYLRHRSDVELYLAQRREHSKAVRMQNRKNLESSGIRTRLLAGRTQ
jgi:uncharacterized protein (DUF433 family)